MGAEDQAAAGQLSGGQPTDHVLALALGDQRVGEVEGGGVLADKGNQGDAGQQQAGGGLVEDRGGDEAAIASARMRM